MSNYIENNIEIKKIFESNTLEDLKRFLNKRKSLNISNSYLIYLFHLLQSSSIFISSIGAGSNSQNLIWIGIGLNIMASLINVYEKTNNNILKKLLNDIKLIKEGAYIDEGILIDIENDKLIDKSINNKNNNIDDIESQNNHKT